MQLIINAETYHCPDVGDIANLKLYGPIDQQSVQIFESTVLELYRKGICRIVLDLSDTKYLNSTGLGLLINIAHKVNVVGGGIRLINVAEKFKVLFDMLGLETCLPILGGYEEAISSFGGRVEDLVRTDGESPAASEDTEQETPQEAAEEEVPEEEDDEGDEHISFEGLLIDSNIGTMAEEEADRLESRKAEEEAQAAAEEAQAAEEEAQAAAEEAQAAAEEAQAAAEEAQAAEEEAQAAAEEARAAAEEARAAEEEEPQEFTFEGFVLEQESAEKLAKFTVPEARPESLHKAAFTRPEHESAGISRQTPTPEAVSKQKSTEMRRKISTAEAATAPKEQTVPQETEPERTKGTGSRVLFEPEKITREHIPDRIRAKSARMTQPEPARKEGPEPTIEIPDKEIAPQPEPPEAQEAPKATEPPKAQEAPKATEPPKAPKPAIVWQTQKRKTSVRYYHQMNSRTTYPMSIVFTEGSHKNKPDAEIKQDSTPSLQNPMVILIPCFPGCQVKPEKVAMDISSTKAVSEFWITPTTKGSPQGSIPAWIEVWYEGKIKEHFPTPFKIVNSVITGFSIAFTLLFALLGVVMDRIQPDISSFPYLVTAVQTLGWRPLGVVCGAVFLLFSVFCFLKFHDRESNPLEKVSLLKMH